MRYNINLDPRMFVTNEFIQKHWHLPVMVEFADDFSAANAKKFRQELSMAEDAALKAKQEVLPILIDSRGGDAYALLGMIDAIEDCQIPVATIVEGRAMSAGAVLFSCGQEGLRFMGPNATIMIHGISAGEIGKVGDLKASSAEAHRLNDIILQKMSTNCGQHLNYFYNLIKENDMADVYMDAAKAHEHNLANKIHIPSFEVDIKMDVKFNS